MTKWLKRLAAITLSVMMALTLFPLIGGVSFTQTAFADDEIVQDDGDVGGGEVVNEEEPAEEVQDENAPTKDGDDPEDPDDPDEPENVGNILIDPYDDEYGWELYSDGNRKFSIYDEDDSGLNLQVRVGMGFVGGGGEEDNPTTVDAWEAQFTGGLLVKSSKKDYTFSSGTLTLFGSAIYSKVKGKYDYITISAALIDDEGTIVTPPSVWEVNVHGVVPDYYELNEAFNYNSPLFLKQSFWLDKYPYGYVENSAHPWGTEFKCTVTKVTTSNKKIVKVKYSKKYKGWSFTGLKKGKATITVKYKGYKKKAKTSKFTVRVVDEGVFCDGIRSVNNEWEGLPGESLELETDAWYEKYNADYDDEHITYEWSIVEGFEDYGEIETNSVDSSKATLTFKDGGDLGEESQYVGVQVTASYQKENGDVFSTTEETEDPEVLYDFYRIRFDETGDLIPDNLDIGQSVTVKPFVQKCQYDSGHDSYSRVENVDFEIYEDDEDGLSVEQTGANTYRITRNDECENAVEFEAIWEEDGNERYCGKRFFFEEINTSLYDYEVQFVGAEDYSYYVGPAGITPEIKVVDMETGYVLPADNYTLSYYKVTWDDENEEEIETPCELPFTYDYDPADPYSGGAGYACYKVIATATDDNEFFDGNTDEDSGYIDIYSDHGLVPAEVTVDTKYDENKTANDLFYEFGGVQYDIPFGTNVTASDFTVKLKEDADALRPGIDYDIMYADWLDEEIELFEEFPTEAGEYACFVVGKGEYIGRANAAIFFVGDKNPATIKTTTKSVSYKKLKKKAQTAKPISVKDPSGELVGDLWFGKWSGSSKLSISDNGTVTVKKKTKKGTYKMVVNVFLSGDNVTAPIDQLVLVTVKVK